MCAKSFFLFGQSVSRKNDFASKLVEFCFEITKENAPQGTIATGIYSLDSTLSRTEEQVKIQYDDGFILERRYSYIPSSNIPNERDNTITSNIYTKNGQNYYYILIQLQSNYTIEQGGIVVYRTGNLPYITSYTYSSAVFGSPITYLIQPKDAKNYIYQYRNPVSGKIALIKVVSWDSPQVTDNTIYSITLCNKELGPDIDGLLKIKKREPIKNR